MGFLTSPPSPSPRAERGRYMLSAALNGLGVRLEECPTHDFQKNQICLLRKLSCMTHPSEEGARGRGSVAVEGASPSS